MFANEARSEVAASSELETIRSRQTNFSDEFFVLAILSLQRRFIPLSHLGASISPFYVKQGKF